MQFGNPKMNKLKKCGFIINFEELSVVWAPWAPLGPGPISEVWAPWAPLGPGPRFHDRFHDRLHDRLHVRVHAR